MITTQKQLIENADAVQEKIAQVQREGMLFIYLTFHFPNSVCVLLIRFFVGLFNSSETCLVPSVDMKQLFDK